MMFIAVCLATVAVVVVVPRMLVLALATLLAASLSARSNRVARRLVADRSIRQDPMYDRKPSRTERRLMRQSLRLALDQTELRSLFPSIVASVDRWTMPLR